MPYDTITLTVDARLATLTINRPDRLNALSERTIDELGRAIEEVHQREDIGALLLTGAGRAFVAGADIEELDRHDGRSALGLSQRGQHVFDQFEASPKPVLAAVNGFALGGGCELAMACHVRVASEAARFGQPEVKLGLIPGYGGTRRLPRLVGEGRALQLLLTGEVIDAQEAFRIGLVNRVVPADQLLPVATGMLRQMLANAPLALSHVIDVVTRGQDLEHEDALMIEATAFGLLAATQDKREGTRAFLEKRAAAFRGA